MYSTTILFSILAVLANCNTATANPNHANPQLVKLVSPELLDRSLLGGDNSYYQTSDGTPYGFGWFHPGAFNEGDRCWQNDREGLIGNALCIIAEIKVGDGQSHPQNFNGWFDSPYYGYGHRFGWYHPGPYLNGDRCFQDGRTGSVQDGLCIDINTNGGRGGNGGLLNGLNLGKRNVWGPDYWREPRFEPAYNFGWFHDGPFAQGDRCWSDGYYGSITDSLCVLAKIDINTKRDDTLSGLTNILNVGGGRSSYSNGERCFKNGNWGRWRSNDCSIIDATAVITDGSYNSYGPFRNGDKCWRAGSFGRWSNGDCSLIDLDLDVVKREPFAYPLSGSRPVGVPCFKDGHEGVIRDAICIIAEVDVDLNRRDHENDESIMHGVMDSFDEANDHEEETYYDDEDQPDVEDAEEGSEDAQYDEEMEKRLFNFAARFRRGHNSALDVMARDMKARSLLGLGNGAGGLDSILPGSQYGQNRQGNALGKNLGSNGLLGGLGGLQGLGRGGQGAGVGGLLGNNNLGARNHGVDKKLGDIVHSIGRAKRSLQSPEERYSSSFLDGLMGKSAKHPHHRRGDLLKVSKSDRL